MIFILLLTDIVRHQSPTLLSNIPRRERGQNLMGKGRGSSSRNFSMAKNSGVSS